MNQCNCTDSVPDALKKLGQSTFTSHGWCPACKVQHTINAMFKHKFAVGYCPNCKIPLLFVNAPFHLLGYMGPIPFECSMFCEEFAKEQGYYVDIIEGWNDIE